MRYESLEVIHGLLKRRFEKLDEQHRAARKELTQAYQDLEDKEGSDAGHNEIELAKMAVETCKRLEKKAARKLDEIRNALEDFEDHEWR